MNQGEQEQSHGTGCTKSHKHSWSKKYYPGLSEEQHADNDEWFRLQLSLLHPWGVLAVPNIKKFFNKKGKELK